MCPKTDSIELSKFYHNRAFAFENLKDYEKVIHDCNVAISLDPCYTKAFLRRARAAEMCDKLLLALEDLVEVCSFEEFKNETTTNNVRKISMKLGKQMAYEKLKSRKFVQISKHYVNHFYISFNNDPVYRNKDFLSELKANKQENK